ncbi:proton-coupled amino acid transporter-like protein CG1139 [Spodoptera litura]|uniref:Proton-coupled amino acid transporter-like protein CG1139 n=1 Tax=Spodoptera litura TaxID=69820 RepID=A0A9J7EDC8_SPOLT|nr:proton-coupled amino acid transporter-like protein CG1139 [Spodoptera litura]
MGPKKPPPPPGVSASRHFVNLTASQADEDSYDYIKARTNAKLTSLIGSIAHLVKGALGGGILSCHVGYMKGGILISLPLHLFCGVYMGYCLYLLVQSTIIIYKRTRIPVMSYADVGEASLMMFPKQSLAKFSKLFRYIIDVIIMVDLFGSCCCYQIIIAKTVKQLVENTPEAKFEGAYAGYPSLRIYLACLIPFIILICLIRHLKYLAPFSIVANVLVAFCVFMVVYYAIILNPTCKGMAAATTPYGMLEFVGLAVFSMSCSGVVIPIENNMAEPHKFPIALSIGMGLIIMGTMAEGFFGYAAFLEKSMSPVTINLPLTLVPKMLKGGIAAMIYVTHALNFWVPFNLAFYYLKKRHPPEKEVFWELLYRAIFVACIGGIAIVFPDINALMGFLGVFCIANMAFVWPNIITLLVIWERPGLGSMKWKLWRGIVLLIIGLIIFVCGSVVAIIELYEVFYKINVLGQPDA